MNKPLAQEYALVHRNANPECFVCGPGLVRLGEGEWVATVPVVPRGPWAERRPKDSRVHIVRSEDGGQTWRWVAQLPYYNATPWLHEGGLYLFAMKGAVSPRNDDLLLLRSDDDGETWSEPATLFKGHYWNCHTGMAVKDGRLYWAVDDLSFGAFRGPRVVVGDLSADPMDSASWRLSNPVPFLGVPDMSKDPKSRGKYGKWLEPNVLDVYGRLRVLARVCENGLCAVFDVEDDGDKVRLEFAQFHPMPGGQLKFHVIWDEASRLFWATANANVNGQGLMDWSGFRVPGSEYKGGDRRLLMLYYSLDGLAWMQAGCVAKAPKLTQSFHYATLAVDGDDLAVLSRSSVNGPNAHDADCATFHRVRGFRDLAMPLLPERG